MSSRRQNPYRGADARTRAAKAAGFPARSVFKLEEIDRRIGLLRAGMRVLDLGAAPGSWSLYASQRLGRGGKLVAVDLAPLTVALGPQAEVLEADAFAPETAAALATRGPFDVVLSDMAPSTSGDRFTDQTRSFDLFCRALELALGLLRPGGAFVGKIFMGGEFDAARARVRAAFDAVRVIRPEATRQHSYEIFLVGTGLRAPPAPELAEPGA
ncbi:MAG: RlmE family RNA methyltransferase [Myxococcales bacterium]|nr:RlmE family RNA methyltransferase [Myxococcales bacterium]